MTSESLKSIGVRVRDLVREICRTHDIEILEGAVSRDHVHVLLSCPPNMSPSKIMQYIKGKTSRKLMMEFKRRFQNATFSKGSTADKPLADSNWLMKSASAFLECLAGD